MENNIRETESAANTSWDTTPNQGCMLSSLFAGKIRRQGLAFASVFEHYAQLGLKCFEGRLRRIFICATGCPSEHPEERGRVVVLANQRLAPTAT